MIHPRRVTSHYLLSGLVKCGYCGKALSGQDAKSGKFAYYVCTSLMKKGAGTCQSRYLNKDKFEAIVISKIKGHILTEHNLKTLVKLINDETDLMASDIKEQLKRFNHELEEVTSRLGKLYDALETGKLAFEDLAPRIKDLRQREERLKENQRQQSQLLSDRKVELADLETVTRYVADLHTLLSEGAFSERKNFIRSFIKEIQVTGDKVILRYTIPVLPQGGTEEELPVLSIEHYGGRSWTRTFSYHLSFAYKFKELFFLIPHNLGLALISSEYPLIKFIIGRSIYTISRKTIPMRR